MIFNINTPDSKHFGGIILSYKSKKNANRYGFVYIWRDRKHNRYYIGCRWGDVNDGYICSSPWMKNAYKRRPEDFKRRVLVSGVPDRQMLLEIEFYYLSKISKSELGNRYYNLHNHRFSHWSQDPIARERIAEQSSQRNKGKKLTPGVGFQKGQRNSIATERKVGCIAHNKGKTLDQIVGSDRAAEIKLKSSQRNKGNNYSPNTQFKKGQGCGADNVNVRPISTPHGQFSSIIDAANVLGVTTRQIQHRLRSEHHPLWIRVNSA